MKYHFIRDKYSYSSEQNYLVNLQLKILTMIDVNQLTVKVLIALLVLFTYAASAQDSLTTARDARKFKVNEINIGLTNLFNDKDFTSELYNVVRMQSDYAIVGIGVGYKHHLTEHHTMKILVNSRIVNKTTKSNDESEAGGVAQLNFSESVVDLYKFQVRPGYEYNLLFTKRLTGIIGFEGIFANSQIEYNTITVSGQTYSDPVLGSQSYSSQTEVYEEQSISAFGYSPVLAIRYFLSQQISLTIEAKYETLYIQSKIDGIEGTKYSGTLPTFRTYIREAQHVNRYLYPVGFLSLNYHF